MKIKTLFPKFDVPILFENLNKHKIDGQFRPRSDCIVLEESLKGNGKYIRIVFLHEMIHATASDKRLMRFARLRNNLGAYLPNSLSYRMEECIAEIGSMICAMKLGLFDEYTKEVFTRGLKDNYTNDMYIPIRELRAAVKYFADDSTSFEDEIQEAKVFCETEMGIKFQESYSNQKAS